MFQQNITLTNKLLQQNSSHRQTTSNDISFYIESSLSKNNENVCLSYFSTPSIGSKKQAFCPILPTASILFSKHTFTYQSIHRIIRKYPNTCTTTQILVGLWMKKKKTQIRLQESRSRKDTHSYCYGHSQCRRVSLWKMFVQRESSAEAVLFLLYYLYIYCSHKKKFHISMYN